jgi:hypothetical protein
MSRSLPVLVYLKRTDRLKLDAVAMMRRMSLSYCLTDMTRDAFKAAFGASADPAEVLSKYKPLLGSQDITTQRAKRRGRVA